MLKYNDLRTMRHVFPVKLSKGKRWQRVVYLNDRVLEIVRRRVRRFPEGSVMRNREGRLWNMSSTSNLFQRVWVNPGRGQLRQLGLVAPAAIRARRQGAQRDIDREGSGYGLSSPGRLKPQQWPEAATKV